MADSSTYADRFSGDVVSPVLPVRSETSRILARQSLPGDAFDLTLERRDLQFDAGMNIAVHGHDPTEDREYSLCSGTRDGELRILFRRIPNGRLTNHLAELCVGDAVTWTGPFGGFTVRDPETPAVFIGTGTGIAPCRAFVRSHTFADLTVLQGARSAAELYYREDWTGHRVVECVSRPCDADRPQYVSQALARLGIRVDADYYLCGGFDMIHTVSRMLQEAGVPRSSIRTEAYYYKAVV